MSISVGTSPAPANAAAKDYFIVGGIPSYFCSSADGAAVCYPFFSFFGFGSSSLSSSARAAAFLALEAATLSAFAFLAASL